MLFLRRLVLAFLPLALFPLSVQQSSAQETSRTELGAQAQATLGGDQPTGTAQPENPQTQEPCVDTVLEAVNNQFGTQLTASSLVIPPGRDVRTFQRGGGLNVYVQAAGLSQEQLDRIRPGRYSTNPRAAVGPTLHMPRAGEGRGINQAVYERGVDDVLGQKVIFTAHLDSANPSKDLAGAVAHFFRDLLQIGRNPCPVSSD